MAAPLAVSLGDPSGIGPEIVAKAWVARETRQVPPFFAVGDARAITAVWRGPTVRIQQPQEAVEAFASGLPVLQLDASETIRAGQPTIDGARHALEALETAFGLTRSGAASALVTGPVSKFQLQGAGFAHPGQTEFIAESCGVAEDNVAMMLAGPGLRVVLVTIHTPLARVPALLTTDLIVAKARIAARGLKKNFGVDQPRLAVAGFNPHAGEQGQMGDEEARFIAPAIAALQAEGIDAFGPVSPDALFTPHVRKTYDAALCMYHDQGLIPLKALHFDEGVNMTLGLPIVRTSPDHGTAFDIAGQGKADPGAMIAALRMAAAAVSHRAVFNSGNA